MGSINVGECIEKIVAPSLHLVHGLQGLIQLGLDSVVLLGHLLELVLERVPLLLKSLDLALKILNLQLVFTEPS